MLSKKRPRDQARKRFKGRLSTAYKNALKGTGKLKTMQDVLSESGAYLEGMTIDGREKINAVREAVQKRLQDKGKEEESSEEREERQRDEREKRARQTGNDGMVRVNATAPSSHNELEDGEVLDFRAPGDLGDPLVAQRHQVDELWNELAARAPNENGDVVNLLTMLVQNLRDDLDALRTELNTLRNKTVDVLSEQQMQERANATIAAAAKFCKRYLSKNDAKHLKTSVFLERIPGATNAQYWAAKIEEKGDPHLAAAVRKINSLDVMKDINTAAQKLRSDLVSAIRTAIHNIFLVTIPEVTRKPCPKLSGNPAFFTDRKQQLQSEWNDQMANAMVPTKVQLGAARDRLVEITVASFAPVKATLFHFLFVWHIFRRWRQGQTLELKARGGTLEQIEKQRQKVVDGGKEASILQQIDDEWARYNDAMQEDNAYDAVGDGGDHDAGNASAEELQ